MKSLATSMLLLWALCWAHCSLSRYGAVQGIDACTCCAAAAEHAGDTHEHDDDDSDHPAHKSADCGVCDFLTHGTPLMQKLPPITAQVADAPPPAVWQPVPLPVLISATLPAQPAAHDPPPLRSLGEVLTRTACPVRGPTHA